MTVRVGLTGGIGSGKSAVAAAFAARGAVVIDADRIAREVVEPGTPALAAIARAFGGQLLRADGALDRAALAAIVFGDPAALRRLEAITHPAIRDRMARDAAAAADAGAHVVVFDHPLLIEMGQTSSVDVVVVVDAPLEVRLERLVTMRGMAESDARARIAAQIDRARRLAAADVVIDNGGSLDLTAAQVGELWERLTVAREWG